MRSNPKHGLTQSMSLRPSLYEGLFNLNDVSLLAFGSFDTVRKKNEPHKRFRNIEDIIERSFV